MIGAFLPVIILIVILAAISSNKNGKTREIKIKYDKKTCRIAVIATIAGGVLLTMGVLILLFEQRLLQPGGADTLFGILFIVGFYMGIPLLILGGCGIIECRMYFRRLRSYGYEVPEDKKNYDSLLNNLPRTEGADADFPGFGRYSRISSRICIGIMLCFVISILYYYKKWNFMPENAEAIVLMMLIADLFWILPVILFRMQANAYKYRDDTENDLTRKARLNLEEDIFIILLLVFVGFMVHYTADSMTEYVFKSKLMQNRDELSSVRNAVKESISDCDTTASETYDALGEGVDITTWGEPADSLQEKIADCLSVEDFTMLRERFALTDGEPQIIVQLKKDSVTVRLANPIPEVGRTNYKMEVE